MECYTWIKYPDAVQSVSLSSQKYTLCEPCATDQIAKETKTPVEREKAQKRFLEDALKKLNSKKQA